jgi:ribosomal-protein-alanine N-acetyltransferase
MDVTEAGSKFIKIPCICNLGNTKKRNEMLVEYSNDTVVLRTLTVADAYIFYNLYSLPKVTVNFDENPFLENEQPIEFTERIIAACERIFTIRLKADPGKIIGDCALHSWNKKTQEMVG